MEKKQQEEAIRRPLCLFFVFTLAGSLYIFIFRVRKRSCLIFGVVFSNTGRCMSGHSGVCVFLCVFIYFFNTLYVLCAVCRWCRCCCCCCCICALLFFAVVFMLSAYWRRERRWLSRWGWRLCRHRTCEFAPCVTFSGYVTASLAGVRAHPQLFCLAQNRTFSEIMSITGDHS